MIAITGASGHLGQWVAARMIDLGGEVVSISRRPRVEPTIEGLSWSRPVATLACDLSSAASVAEAGPLLREAEAVVHLAAFIPPDTARDPSPLETLHANVRGTVNLLRELRSSRALKSLVFASTFEVYGAPRATAISEAHSTRPLTFYGASKLAGEHYGNLFSRDTGVAFCALRFPAIYGPGETKARALGNFIRAAAAGAALTIEGDGSDVRDLLYASDAAAAIALAVSRRARGPFNVADGRGYSIREIAEAVRRAAAKPLSIFVRERVKKRVDYVLDTGRVRKDLGFSPRTGLDAGIRAQLEWVSRGQRSGGRGLPASPDSSTSGD